MDLNETIQQELMGSGEKAANPIKITINGNNMEFDSVEQLNENLTQALSSVGAEYKQMKERLTELENQRGQVVEDDAPVQDTGKFSQEKFLNLLKENPVDAFDYVDSFRYGVEKPSEYIKNNLKQSEEARQELEVNRWLQRHPEFPGGEYAPVLDKVRMQMNLPLTAQNLELAYQTAIQNQVLPDFKTIAILNFQRQQLLQEIQNNGGTIPQNILQGMPQNQQGQENWRNDFQGKPVRIPAPPPRVPQGGNQGTQLSEEQLENLSMEQIERILRKHGAL